MNVRLFLSIVQPDADEAREARARAMDDLCERIDRDMALHMEAATFVPHHDRRWTPTGYEAKP